MTTENKHRILVVDDSHDTAQSLAALLKVMGHEARFEIDPTRVVALVREVHPNIVFLDLGMPGIDGYRLAETLRSEFGHSIHLVAVTGYGTEQDRARSRRAGFDAHVLKPMDIPLLESILITVTTEPRRSPKR